MSDLGFFLIVTGLALISLGLTFVLFRFLKSSAQGQGKLLGGTIRYGGSLAGFVLVFGLLFGAFHQLRRDPGETTPISLAGKWSLELHPSSGAVVHGSATIRQRRNDPVLDISGELVETPITFNSIVGVIRNRNIYLIYENLDRERGLIRGQVIEDTPKTLHLVYTDLVGYDLNKDPSGILILTRKE
ncbi:MAG: hypothetical protein ABI779_09075 [Acidobacteriota bacterium]